MRIIRELAAYVPVLLALGLSGLSISSVKANNIIQPLPPLPKIPAAISPMSAPVHPAKHDPSGHYQSRRKTRHRKTHVKKNHASHSKTAALPPLKIIPFSMPIPADVAPYAVPSLPDGISVDISRWRLLSDRPDKMLFLDTQTIQPCDTVSGNDCYLRARDTDPIHGYAFWGRYVLRPLHHAAVLRPPVKFYLNCEHHEINGYEIIPETPEESFYTHFCNIEQTLNP